MNGQTAVSAPFQSTTPLRFTLRRFLLRRFLLALALLPLLASPAAAHVQLDTPNGGETLAAGDTVEIRWHVVFPHELQNWDLWYSTTGPTGPWIPLAADLPAGDGTAGAVHTHQWTVPADASDEVRVRVRQDNVGTDYYDLSDDDLSIAVGSSIFADGFESGGTGAWSSTAGGGSPG